MKRLLVLVSFLCLAGLATAQTNLEFCYAFSDEPRSGWIEDRISEWNAANADSGFQVVGERKGSYRETLEAAVLASRQGNPPHLAQLFEVGSQLAVDSGIFKPIGEVGGGIDLSDYIEPVINYYTIDGTVNSIPFNSSSPILYGNQGLMDQAGISEMPATYGALLEACAAIEAAGIESSCLTFPLHGWFFEQWIAEQGATLVNGDNGRAERATETLLNSEAALNIGNFMKALADGGYYNYTGKLEDWSGSEAIFGNQESVFFITSTADAGNITANAVENGFDVITGLLPIADGAERNGVVIGGASVWLLDGHPDAQLEAARDFVIYMTNTENMVSWHKLTGYYPVRNSSVDALTEEGWFTENPNFSVAFDQLLDTIPNTATGGALSGSFLDMRTIVGEALQKIYNGADVNEALNEAKELADARMNEYNSNF